jgi:hypothetical protein
VSAFASLGLIATSVPAFGTMMPALRSPMNAMNRPMPAAMALRMLGLIASMIASRTPTSDSTRNRTPATNTSPSATRHGSATPAAPRVMITDTKKKFSPMPGASAMG